MRLRIVLLWIALNSRAVLHAEDGAFDAKIRPLLQNHCQRCHGGEDSRGGFDVRTSAAILRGSRTGKVLVPGSADRSLLMQLVAPQSNPHMPPKGQLSNDEIADLQSWINSLKPTIAANEKGRDQWAFQRLKIVAPPTMENPTWVRNPIDAFVLNGLGIRGMKPTVSASRSELVRRVYFDLIGLPPSPEDMAAACEDRADNWYEKIVDRLLASPLYGERWGRHWLDLARHADSSGFHNDLDRPQAWRYRDYVIRSFNDDKPYGQFIREQLAGDEVDASNPDCLAATGFCIAGPSNDDNMGQETEKYRLEQLDGLIATTSNVFLGLTFGCARCHDHKYDPVSQEDYYRFLAIFHNADRREVPLVAGKVDPAAAKLPNRKTPLKGDFLTFFSDGDAKPRKTYLLWRGNVDNRGPEVQPGVPAALTAKTRDFPAESTKRRLALADWIASPDNALTYRIIANRLWQHHFGRGIVLTTSNFGLTGERPTHPELLDWLASELIRNGGRFKPLHRLMVLSATYQQASRWDNWDGAKLDPQNLFLGRMNKRRLEAEAIRDSILAVSGKLNLQMGGPGIKPRIHPDLLVASQRNKWPRIDKEGHDLWRRSVYVYMKRQLLFPMLQLFDAPTSNQSCGRREQSTVPTQALILMNDPFMQDQAGYFAHRLRSETGHDPTRWIEHGFHLALAQSPSPSRIADARHFLDERRQTYEKAGVIKVDAERDALIDLCHVLFNCNEFIYVE